LDQEGRYVGEDEEEGDLVRADGTEVSVAGEVGDDPAEEDVVAWECECRYFWSVANRCRARADRDLAYLLRKHMAGR
jgi:hypothetical protein